MTPEEAHAEVTRVAHEASQAAKQQNGVTLTYAHCHQSIRKSTQPRLAMERWL